MNKVGNVVEYLCFSCGTQGMVERPESELEHRPMDKRQIALRCPKCGKKVSTYSFRIPEFEPARVTV